MSNAVEARLVVRETNVREDSGRIAVDPDKAAHGFVIGHTDKHIALIHRDSDNKISSYVIIEPAALDRMLMNDSLWRQHKNN